MLYDDSGFLGMFNHSLKKDEFVRPDGLAKNATTTQEDWLTNTDLKSAFPTFGPTVNRYLKSQGFESETADDQWSMIKDLLECFELSHFLINQGDGPPYLSFFRMDEVLSEHQSAIEACNALSKYYHQTYLFERDKGKYLQQLKSDYQKAMKYVDHTRQKMDLLSQKRPFDELANIIMANLHAIPKGASKVELYDFYRNSQIEIKLKPESSPQHQAEQYYRKSKNRFKEKENLELNLQKKAAEIEEKQRLIDEITAISDRKKLNQFVPAHFPDKTNTKNDIRLPFYRHDIDGFEIRIGKSAKDNDLMLRQFSHKDDLWLHARDVSGSHVLIKHQKKTAISASIIERAAQMAAFYSKRKHDTLAPVIYTPRKFVRKAKNLLPGQVLVEKEQVIIVSPLKEPKPSH
jgi:predicted ribosome quality control (RQC) complex YloA/Tae2 family protein